MKSDSSKKPCFKEKELYDYGIVDKEVGVKLELVEERDHILIYKKRVNNNVGYIFIVCEDLLDEAKFREYYKLYSRFVKEAARGMFKEVELVFAVSKIEGSTLEVIKKYNEVYTERKPIRYVIIGS